jgi:hypothetical protein
MIAGAFFRSSVGEAQQDAAHAKQLRSKYLDQQRTRDRLLLVRAVERGDVRGDLDIDNVTASLIAPILYRIIVTGQPVTRRFTANLVRCVLAQVGMI